MLCDQSCPLSTSDLFLGLLKHDLDFLEFALLGLGLGILFLKFLVQVVILEEVLVMEPASLQRQLALRLLHL